MISTIRSRIINIILTGLFVTIVLFSISAYYCYFAIDIVSANLFASFGIKALTLFFFIALADALAQIILKRRKKD